jgi:hypothetical protein
MAQPRVRHVPLSALTVICLSCTPEAAARLEVDRDTLVLYGQEFTRVPVRLVDDTGGSSRARGVRITSAPKALLAVRGSSLACRREGLSTVQLELEEHRTPLVVKCRFARHIRTATHLELQPGGDPRALGAVAVFSTGDSEVVRPVAAVSSDSSAVAIRNSAVVPLAIGDAALRIDFGGVHSRMSVEVRHILADDTLELKPGELRVWPLTAGRYTVTVRVKASRDLGALNMETEGLSCSRSSSDEDTIHCLAVQGAEVRMRNTSSGSSARTARAFVGIVHVP